MRLARGAAPPAAQLAPKRAAASVLLLALAALQLAGGGAGEALPEGQPALLPEAQGGGGGGMPLPTIFAAVASFRDVQCKDTLAALFELADAPERIFVGVCEQNAEPGEECWSEALRPHAARVRRVQLNATEAQGPIYARHLAATLYRGEAYYLQLDAHTTFVRGWDTQLRAMHAALPDPARACLTAHPAPHDQTTDHVPILCISRFQDDGMPTVVAAMFSAKDVWRPHHEVPFVAGGFLYCPATMLAEVPFDPDLPELFAGEEVLHAARLWTAGYRFYVPPENALFHDYTRHTAPRFWNNRDAAYHARVRATVAKVRLLMAGGLPGYRYGFGPARTLAEYWAFARMDPVARTSGSKLAFCGLAD